MLNEKRHVEAEIIYSQQRKRRLIRRTIEFLAALITFDRQSIEFVSRNVAIPWNSRNNFSSLNRESV